MLSSAVKAKIPLITVTTRDTVNIESALLSETLKGFKLFDPASPTKNKHTYILRDFGKVNHESLYKLLQSKGVVVVAVNPDIPLPTSFDAGEIQPPQADIWQALGEVVHIDDLEELVGATAGLTLKEVIEVANITMVEKDYLNAKTFKEIRPKCIKGCTGLTPIDPDYKFYKPNKELQEWVDTTGVFLSSRTHRNLRPRGVLFYGEAGTGKTLGAKYLAKTLEVPLFSLSIGTMLGKYVGESESRLQGALRVVESESPAVMIIDEVEKLFDEDTANQVGKSLLAILLWWLQEHNTNVLTVMTTNSMESIPKELYRAGRIDKCMVFEKMSHYEAAIFMEEYLSVAGYGVEKGAITEESLPTLSLTPANLIEECKTLIRKHIIQEGDF